MDYKLLALDLDGTLLSDELIISDKNIKAIKAAQKKGVKVVIATGRPNIAAERYLQPLGLDEYLITYNGALIKEIKTDKIVKHSPVPLNLAHKILEYVSANELYVNLYLAGKVYANRAGQEAAYYRQLMGVEPTIIKGSVMEFLTEPSTKLLIIEKDLAKVKKIMTELTERFSSDLNITDSLSDCIDIMDQGVSKGSALKDLIKRLGISKQQIIAVGDRANDLEMIDYVGKGVAVGNAEKRLKDKADYITTSNNQSGVAAAIEKFIL